MYYIMLSVYYLQVCVFFITFLWFGLWVPARTRYHAHLFYYMCKADYYCN
jgi:hypothetical protein